MKATQNRWGTVSPACRMGRRCCCQAWPSGHLRVASHACNASDAVISLTASLSKAKDS